MDDLKMIKTPDEWPAWPFLPLKRYKESQFQCRVLWIGARDRLVHTNIFDLPKTKEQFLSLEFDQYNSPEAIVADGWMVD